MDGWMDGWMEEGLMQHDSLSSKYVGLNQMSADQTSLDLSQYFTHRVQSRYTHCSKRDIFMTTGELCPPNV